MEVRPDLPDPLFVITDTTHIWIYVDLYEKDLSRVHAGQRVEIQADAYPDLQLRGEVHHMGDVVDPNTHRLMVTLTVTNPDKLLKLGMYVRVLPHTKQKQPVMLLPNGAFITEGQHS